LIDEDIQIELHRVNEDQLSHAQRSNTKQCIKTQPERKEKHDYA